MRSLKARIGLSDKGRMRTFIARLGFACLLVLPLAAPTGAAATTVSGTVKGAKNYTVAAVSRDGTAQMRRLRASGAFRLTLGRAAARQATLALIARDGSYFGPVVLRSGPGRAHLALSGRGNPRLGTVRLRRGYAKPVRPLPRRAVDMGRVSRTDATGRPLGAGRLGLVQPPTSAGAADHAGDGGQPDEGGAGQPGEDTDDDGLVGTFDIDDDGDGILDPSDPGGTASGIRGELISSLPVDLEDSLNANATGVTSGQIDALLRERLNLLLNFSTDQLRDRVSSVGVDCMGVGWCRTAEVIDHQRNRSMGLWRDLDSNRDGLFDLPRGKGAPVFQISIWPRANTSQIAPGDTLQFVASTERGKVRVPAILPMHFTTVPAVKTWDDGSGPQEISYPVPPGTPGTRDRTLQLSGDKLTLTFWRPQRAAIPGAEAGAFTDMGRLYYGVDFESGGCAPEHYSNLSPNLEVAPSSFDRDENMVLKDSADDAAVNPDRTLSFTVDLGACLRRAGVDPSGRFEVLTLRAGDEARDAAGQHLNIRLP